MQDLVRNSVTCCLCRKILFPFLLFIPLLPPPPLLFLPHVPPSSVSCLTFNKLTVSRGYNATFTGKYARYQRDADAQYIQYLSKSHETQRQMRFKLKEVPSIYLRVILQPAKLTSFPKSIVEES